MVCDTEAGGEESTSTPRQPYEFDASASEALVRRNPGATTNFLSWFQLLRRLLSSHSTRATSG